MSEDNQTQTQPTRLVRFGAIATHGIPAMNASSEITTAKLIIADASFVKQCLDRACQFIDAGMLRRMRVNGPDGVERQGFFLCEWKPICELWIDNNQRLIAIDRRLDTSWEMSCRDVADQIGADEFAEHIVMAFDDFTTNAKRLMAAGEQRKKWQEELERLSNP